MDAAKFLKKSGLSDVVLSRVSKFFFYGRSLIALSVEEFQDRLLITLIFMVRYFYVLGVGLV